jgi:glycosyltransferase involved in cell wall biosynthesis
MDESDIMVVPLTDNVYNRCKSNIKWSESGSACKPGVWQRIRQYADCIKVGHTGFLASTSQEWYDSIKTLIEDPELRKRMGKEVFQEVKKNWTIQGHIKDYAEYFRGILT